MHLQKINYKERSDIINKIDVKIKKLIDSARIPEYKTPQSAGFDFYAVVDGVIELDPSEIRTIRTGLSMEIPDGYELQVRPRSGLSLTTKLRITNSPGTIDADFRGEILIIVENIGTETITINHHDRIAQGVLNEVPQANFIIAEELSDTERGDGGFGHTGK